MLSGVTKISSRRPTSPGEQDRIAEILAKYTMSPELELQRRAVEFSSLFNLGELREGVLERMPPPELKAAVMEVGELNRDSLWFYHSAHPSTFQSVSENKPVGLTQHKDVCHIKQTSTFPAE